MATEIHLRTNDDSKFLALVDIQDAAHSDYFSAMLQVASRGFSCKHRFYFDRFYAEQMVAALEGMVSGKVVKGILKQEFEKDHIIFVNDRLGHVYVSGEVSEQGTDHSLMFVISTDQTVLRPFIDELRAVIGI